MRAVLIHIICFIKAFLDWRFPPFFRNFTSRRKSIDPPRPGCKGGGAGGVYGPLVLGRDSLTTGIRLRELLVRWFAAGELSQRPQQGLDRIAFSFFAWSSHL